MKEDIWSLFKIALLGSIIVLLASCKVKEYIPVESVRTEYQDRYLEKVDTVSVVDSTFVYVKGDTLYIYKYRDRWRDRVVRDTSFIIKTDSISVPYPVERELTFWEKTYIDVGKSFFIVLFCWVLYKIIKWIWNRIISNTTLK